MLSDGAPLYRRVTMADTRELIDTGSDKGYLKRHQQGDTGNR